MEMKNLLLVLIALVFCLAAFADSRALVPGTSNNVKDVNEPSWCIAQDIEDTSSLQNNINFCCNEIGIDCSPIQPGGPCFFPDELYFHASYVMNLYYLKAGKNAWDCDFKGTGLIINEDPSYGSCIFQVI